MKGIVLTTSGTMTGVAIAFLCTAGDLQSLQYFPTLATVLSVTGVAAGFTGDWAIQQLKRHGCVYSRNHLARTILVLKEASANVGLEHNYLPEAVWKNTGGCLEKIAVQVNVSFQHGSYDGASVLLRRLIETLLIECYEHEKTQSRITDSEGNYFMLSGIITDAVDKRGLPLSRDTKSLLRDLKVIGDRAAHSRRCNVVRADLERVRLRVRFAVDELIQLAELRRG